MGRFRVWGGRRAGMRCSGVQGVETGCLRCSSCFVLLMQAICLGLSGTYYRHVDIFGKAR